MVGEYLVMAAELAKIKSKTLLPIAETEEDVLTGGIGNAVSSSKNSAIVAKKRIGVDYAGDDSNLQWRFYIKGNQYISKK